MRGAKRYLCLFLCLKTHCCPLEMASSLDTDTFLDAFVRMTARRGWPQKMLSDNGTNLICKRIEGTARPSLCYRPRQDTTDDLQ